MLLSAAHTFNRNVLVLQGVQYTCQCVHMQWLCMSLYNDNQNIQMLLHDATVAGVARYGDVPEAVLSRGKTVSKKNGEAGGSSPCQHLAKARGTSARMVTIESYKTQNPEAADGNPWLILTYCNLPTSSKIFGISKAPMIIPWKKLTTIHGEVVAKLPSTTDRLQILFQRDPAGLPMGWIWTPNGVVGVSWYMGHICNTRCNMWHTCVCSNMLDYIGILVVQHLPSGKLT